MKRFLKIFSKKPRVGRPRKVDTETKKAFSRYMIICIIILFALLSITVLKIQNQNLYSFMLGNINIEKNISISKTRINKEAIQIKINSKENVSINDISISDNNSFYTVIEDNDEITIVSLNEGIKKVVIKINYNNNKTSRKTIYFK